MLKKITLLLLTLSLLLGLSLSAHASAVDQEEMYAALQEELRDRLMGTENAAEFTVLAENFADLGSYQKSAQFRSYTTILADAEAGQFANLSTYARVLRLDGAFCKQLADMGLPSVDEIEAYALGRQAEAAGNAGAAISFYEKSIGVLDSMIRLTELLMTAPAATPEPTPEPVPESSPAPAAAVFVAWKQQDDFAFTTYSDGTCILTKYTGDAKQVVVPDTLGGCRVVAIGESAFAHNRSLSGVVLPDSVTSIGDFTFLGCILLKDVELPASLLSIGKQAFSQTFLQEVVLPESLTTLGDLVFHQCTALTSIKLPDSLVTIGSNPFIHCIKLESVVLSANHPVLTFGDGILIDKSSMRLVSNLPSEKIKRYTVPDGIQVIGDYVFYANSHLTQVTLPDSVTAIGSYAFYGCPSLKTANLPGNVVTIGEGAFASCRKLTLAVQQDTLGYQYVIENDLRHKAE